MQRLFTLWLLIASITLLASCTRSSVPRYSGTDAETPAPTSALTTLGDLGAPTAAPGDAPALQPSADGQPLIVVDAAGAAQPIDRRLFGTNVPAWLGPDRLGSDDTVALTRALGSPLLRLPGGSWSNSYDWLACENGDEQGCFWTWAARPTDFLNFVRATGSEAMWTVSMNGTAQEAAALVAFFNGSVDDTTLIGVDPRGRDWKTVGDWARLRAEHGNPAPLPIRLWEVGNEVYGGKPEAGGAACAPWGWEDVWTCDGAEYVSGKGEGADHHQGYLEFRAAMRAVDPGIQVGAVGVADPGGWSNWGNKVIGVAGEDLDFYIVHHYAYEQTPLSAQAILARPQQIWSQIMGDVGVAFERYAGGRRAPVAVTEYNLVAFQDLDSGQMMNQMANALFIADTVGQMAQHGVAMATQWALMNGRASNGTDYGLIDADTGKRAPQYYAMALWSRFGESLVPVSSSLSAETTLSVYAGRSEDGSLSLLAINKMDDPVQAQIRFDGLDGAYLATADLLTAASIEATDIQFNGVAAPAVDLDTVPPADLGAVESAFEHTFPPYSITLIRLKAP